ncbi:MAG: geranylgeranyl reductase, partial [Cyanobacteriota bacterium]|nr:geranylgeranyl reductase [Cyanobacteriota bacterium]
WQQIKLTVRTLASVLRGQALAPSRYEPVESAVRSHEEAERLLNGSHSKPNVKTISGQPRLDVLNADRPSASKDEESAVLIHR